MTSFPAQYLNETATWAAQTFEVRIPGAVSYEALEEALATRLEMLISKDFQHFVYLLYRIDISEKKIRQLLEDAAAVNASPYRAIAAMIIERQLQKIESRAAFRNRQPDDDEEKW
ncbi:hypothetical protein [Chitinophaga vietnamensis]|uniref:hypothetical protein n=1 Tax=Chitinophaga vietnamensis TaxID=2593957 RepID=UPI001177CECC|nr:hypothetical protein [Chitinophaga vietnamensis]